MRILLTGAAGLVGRAAAPVLRAAGHEVISTDRPGTGAGPDAQADLADAAQAAALIGGRFAAVVHAAAIPQPGQHPADVALRNNLMATFNVIEACLGSGVRRLVNRTAPGVPAGCQRHRFGQGAAAARLAAVRGWRDYLTESGEPR